MPWRNLQLRVVGSRRQVNMMIFTDLDINGKILWTVTLVLQSFVTEWSLLARLGPLLYRQSLLIAWEEIGIISLTHWIYIERIRLALDFICCLKDVFLELSLEFSELRVKLFLELIFELFDRLKSLRLEYLLQFVQISLHFFEFCQWLALRLRNHGLLLIMCRGWLGPRFCQNSVDL